MSKALEAAMTAVAYGRNDRANAVAKRNTAYDDRREFTATYAGYKNGQHYGKLPNGGTVPVTPKSNGSIPYGTVFNAQRGSGRKLFGAWMPR